MIFLLNADSALEEYPIIKIRPNPVGLPVSYWAFALFFVFCFFLKNLNFDRIQLLILYTSAWRYWYLSDLTHPLNCWPASLKIIFLYKIMTLNSYYFLIICYLGCTILWIPWVGRALPRGWVRICDSWEFSWKHPLGERRQTRERKLYSKYVLLLECIFQGQYLSSLSINYVAINELEI